jgi:hypothetical protein
LDECAGEGIVRDARTLVELQNDSRPPSGNVAPMVTSTKSLRMQHTRDTGMPM